MAVADQEVADALRRSFLGRLPRDIVDELIADGQRTDYPAGSTSHRELYDTLQQTAINTFGSVKQRVATALLDLASAQQRPQDRLVAQVSQQELADAVGSVREVVARALREFRLAGLVATGPDSVLIVDPTGLHDQAWSAAAE